MRVSRTSLIPLLVCTIFFAGCESSTQDVGPSEIKMPLGGVQTLAITDVYRGEERLATLRTKTLPVKGLTYEELTDQRGRAVGIIQEGIASRYLAHDGLVPVASGSDRRTLVAALLGVDSSSELQLREESLAVDR